MSWLNLINNTKTTAIRKTMYEFLKERYPANDPIVERLAHSLQTEGDIKAFMKLIVDVYEMAYTKAVEDHREQLAKAGLTVRITQPKAG